MVLSHGDAAVEGGFPINKELIIDNMLEDTVVAQRVVLNAIWNAGMDIKNVDITPKMCHWWLLWDSHMVHTRQHLKQNKRDPAGE